MYLTIRTRSSKGYGGYRSALKQAGFRGGRSAFSHYSSSRRETTSVCALDFQREIMIYWGPTGEAVPVSGSNMSAAAKSALDLALEYVDLKGVTDHNEYKVDPMELLR